MNEVDELKEQVKLLQDMYRKDTEELAKERDMWKERVLKQDTSTGDKRLRHV